jgi:hypothetical protein
MVVKASSLADGSRHRFTQHAAVKKEIGEFSLADDFDFAGAHGVSDQRHIGQIQGKETFFTVLSGIYIIICECIGPTI